MRKLQRPEHVRAREWREHKNLTREALSQLIGYSKSVIQDFELGYIRGSGKPIGENEWKRYRLACAAINADLEFDWNTQ